MHTELADRLTLLKQTLQWGHLAPTAPDTLAMYPYQKTDPFCLEQCPHVYFAGNQPEFGTDVVEGPAGQKVRVILVPRFATTLSAVLVNLSTLDCHVINFGASTGPAGQGASAEAGSSTESTAQSASA